MAVNQDLSGHQTSSARPWSLAAVFFILFAAAFLIYGDSLRAPFYFDDLTKIIENPHIRLTRLDLSQIKEIPRDQPAGRSVPFFTFALNYYFHQDQVTGYHLFNILIHIGCGWMVFLLTGQTLRLCGRESLLIPLLAALLWLTHPLHTQSVTYIVQRINSLAALFYLMTLWLYINFRLALKNKEPVRLLTSSPVLPAAAALGCGLLALLSKQNSASLPVIILLYEWYFFQNRDRSWVKKNWPWLLALVLSIVIIALVYLGGNPIDKIMAGYEKQPFNLGQRLLSQGRVIIYYLSLLVFPHPGRLNIDYDFPVSTGLADPATTALALAALAALLAAAGMAKKDRLLSFALLWFLVTLAVESSFIGLMLIFEHRTYLPSVFPVIALTAVFFRHVRPVSLAVILLTAFMAVNGYWTFQRNTVWQDRLVFWRDCAEKSPDKARPRNNYGMALADSDDFEAAVTEYERSIELSRGTEPYPHNNLGMLYFQRGDLTRAADHFKKAIRTDLDFFKPYLNLGTLLNQSGDNQRALAFLEEALRHNRYFPAIHVALAKAYYETGDTDRAIDHCRRALELDPLDVSAENNLGAILLGQGQAERALPHLKKVLEMAPNHPEANINTGIAYYELGKVPRAAFHLERAVFLAPEHPGARAELGIVLLREGRPEKARQHLEKAVELKPDYLKARLALAEVFLEQGRAEPAAEQYRLILELNPGNETARKRLEVLSGAITGR